MIKRSTLSYAINGSFRSGGAVWTLIYCVNLKKNNSRTYVIHKTAVWTAPELKLSPLNAEFQALRIWNTKTALRTRKHAKTALFKNPKKISHSALHKNLFRTLLGRRKKNLSLSKSIAHTFSTSYSNRAEKLHTYSRASQLVKCKISAQELPIQKSYDHFHFLKKYNKKTS